MPVSQAVVVPVNSAMVSSQRTMGLGDEDIDVLFMDWILSDWCGGDYTQRLNRRRVFIVVIQVVPQKN
jgi:hypothetical protein